MKRTIQFAVLCGLAAAFVDHSANAEVYPQSEFSSPIRFYVDCRKTYAVVVGNHYGGDITNIRRGPFDYVNGVVRMLPQPFRYRKALFVKYAAYRCNWRTLPPRLGGRLCRSSPGSGVRVSGGRLIARRAGSPSQNRIVNIRFGFPYPTRSRGYCLIELRIGASVMNWRTPDRTIGERPCDTGVPNKLNCWGRYYETGDGVISVSLKGRRTAGTHPARPLGAEGQPRQFCTGLRFTRRTLPRGVDFSGSLARLCVRAGVRGGTVNRRGRRRRR